MATFKDSTGRDWVLAIDAWTVKQVRIRTGVELGKLLDDNMRPLVELVSNCERLVDVLWVLCEEQAARVGVNEVQFARGLGGDGLEQAVRAFEEAFALFCPSRQREILRALAAKVQSVEAATTAKALAAIEAIDPNAVTTSTPSASKPLASSVATPEG